MRTFFSYLKEAIANCCFESLIITKTKQQKSAPEIESAFFIQLMVSN